MSEKFCLKWNDFYSNVSKSFGLFRNEVYLHDVTLVSDDHKEIAAHKLVLSACSEYFKNIFKLHSNKPNVHPLICLDGITSDDLHSIMDYIYNGEVQIFQDNLDRFLTVAQRLKLEGLLGNNEEEENHVEESNDYVKEDPTGAETTSVALNKTMKVSKERKVAKVDKVLMPVSSEYISDVQNTVQQYMEKDAAGNAKCIICGKQAVDGRLRNLEYHIETHLEGLSFPCQLCGKTFRSRNAFSTHRSRDHR